MARKNQPAGTIPLESLDFLRGIAALYVLANHTRGAFFAGGLAAAAMLFLNQRTKLKEDAVIGLIFTSFFGIGLFMVIFAGAGLLYN